MDHPRFLSDATSYAQRNQLYENEGGKFREVSSGAGAPFAEERVSRGTAFGDVDDDGDVDLLVMNNNDTPNLLRNEIGNENHWLALQLVGVRSNRDGIGALVRLTADGLSRVDEIHSGGSYLSQSDLRLYFGLGKAARIERLEIRWPSGETQSFKDLEVDRLLIVREGGEPFSW